MWTTRVVCGAGLFPLSLGINRVIWASTFFNLSSWFWRASSVLSACFWKAFVRLLIFSESSCIPVSPAIADGIVTTAKIIPNPTALVTITFRSTATPYILPLMICTHLELSTRGTGRPIHLFQSIQFSCTAFAYPFRSYEVPVDFDDEMLPSLDADLAIFAHPRSSRKNMMCIPVNIQPDVRWLANARGWLRKADQVVKTYTIFSIRII